MSQFLGLEEVLSMGRFDLNRVEGKVFGDEIKG